MEDTIKSLTKEQLENICIGAISSAQSSETEQCCSNIHDYLLNKIKEYDDDNRAIIKKRDDMKKAEFYVNNNMWSEFRKKHAKTVLRKYVEENLNIGDTTHLVLTKTKHYKFDLYSELIFMGKSLGKIWGPFPIEMNKWFHNLNKKAIEIYLENKDNNDNQDNMNEWILHYDGNNDNTYLAMLMVIHLCVDNIVLLYETLNNVGLGYDHSSDGMNPIELEDVIIPKIEITRMW